MGKTVAYIRVSTKDQNLDRQKEEMPGLGIEEKHIYEDKASGKDFDPCPLNNVICLEGLYTKWQHGQITAVEFMGRLGLKRNTFYKIIKQYGQKLS